MGQNMVQGVAVQGKLKGDQVCNDKWLTHLYLKERGFRVPKTYLSLQETMKAMTDICVARYEAFGTAGNASKIKPVSLEKMFQRYEAGELDPKVR